jgi:hypothetical protein
MLETDKTDRPGESDQSWLDKPFVIHVIGQSPAATALAVGLWLSHVMGPKPDPTAHNGHGLPEPVTRRPKPNSQRRADSAVSAQGGPRAGGDR